MRLRQIELNLQSRHLFKPRWFHKGWWSRSVSLVFSARLCKHVPRSVGVCRVWELASLQHSCVYSLRVLLRLSADVPFSDIFRQQRWHISMEHKAQGDWKSASILAAVLWLIKKPEKMTEGQLIMRLNSHQHQERLKIIVNILSNSSEWPHATTVTMRVVNDIVSVTFRAF